MWKVLDLVLDVHDSQGNARPLRSVGASLAQSDMTLHSRESSRRFCSLSPVMHRIQFIPAGRLQPSWLQIFCPLGPAAMVQEDVQASECELITSKSGTEPQGLFRLASFVMSCLFHPKAQADSRGL